MRQLIYITFLVFQSWAILSQCPCAHVPIDSSISNFKNIISVELIAKSKNNQKLSKQQQFPKGIINEFKIIEVYTGRFEPGDTITSLTGNGREDNGFVFEIGEQYILFHERYIDKCSPTQKYNRKMSLKLHSILNPNKPPPIPLPPSYTSKMWKYETNANYYWNGLKAEIIGENKEETLDEFYTQITNSGEISANSLITIKLNNEGRVIQSRIISQAYDIEADLPKSLKIFIEQNFIFQTKDERCLIENSTWRYRYK